MAQVQEAPATEFAQTKSTEFDLKCEFEGEGDTLGWGCWDPESGFVMDVCVVVKAEKGPENMDGHACDNTCNMFGEDQNGNDCEWE